MTNSPLSFINDFPMNNSIYKGFHIAMFDDSGDIPSSCKLLGGALEACGQLTP